MNVRESEEWIPMNTVTKYHNEKCDKIHLREKRDVKNAFVTVVCLVVKNELEHYL